MIKNYKKGFTLLELLVVVLIIGILAAIALPQYRLAVDKARVAKYLDIGRNIRQAQERHYMANGEYAYDLGKLDIEYDPSCITVHPNMFYNCMSGEVLINNVAAGYKKAAGALRIYYCPSLRGVEQNSYSQCIDAQELVIYFSYANYYTACTGITDRGQRICKALGGFRKKSAQT